MKNFNLKNILRTKSIAFKVWIYFLVLIVIVGFLVWFLQVFMLNNYYEDMKIASNNRTIGKIISSYKNNDIDKFLSEVEEISGGDDVFIKLKYHDKPMLVSNPQLENYQKELDLAEGELKNSHDKEGISVVVKGRDTNRKTWIYVGYLDDIKDRTIYLVSPLYPVASSVKILQQQLVYILMLSFLISIGFAFFTSQRIAVPIKKISSQADKLARGSYGINFSEDYNYEEINQLASTLNRASVEIDKSMELQKDLIANISHDLKTPLTMVKSYAEMIRDISGDLKEKRNRHLNIIIEEADRLNVLVNDILTLSLAQANTLKLNIQAFSIEELFKSVIQTYDILQKNEGYQIMFNCRQDVQVLGDPSRIKQVISNLMTNAIKYCGEDKKIYVNVKKWGNRVHCEIVDNGQGIKAEELPHIWERYYKSSTNHIRKTKGSGIGLSIVKEIINAHNGRLGVESQVGVGTTFWFELEVSPTENLMSKS